MKHVMMWALVAALVAATYILVATGLPNTVRVPRPTPGYVSDQEAVEISRRALQMAGYELSDYEPRSYNESDFFGRNIYNANDGYVLWHRKSKTDSGVTVHMELQGDSMVCKMSRFH